MQVTVVQELSKEELTTEEQEMSLESKLRRLQEAMIDATIIALESGETTPGWVNAAQNIVNSNKELLESDTASEAQIKELDDLMDRLKIAE